MPLFRCSPAFVLLITSFAVASNAQTEKTFPTNDEINLVLTQTERAMEIYRPIVDQQEKMSEGAKDAIARDRQVVNALETAVKAFKGTPQRFNGPLGFAFFEWLDDATRNALLCSADASTQATLQIMAGNKNEAESSLQLAHSCADVSTLIYTVSENAGALYLRYVTAEEQLSGQGAELAKQCTDVLKKKSVPPKK